MIARRTGSKGRTTRLAHVFRHSLRKSRRAGAILVRNVLPPRQTLPRNYRSNVCETMAFPAEAVF
jgi:hypothetical protein